MVSLIVHAVLGVAVVALVIRLNPGIFARPPGPALSAVELAFYVVGLASIPICWYFNMQFVAQYANRTATRSGGREVGRSSSRSATPIRRRVRPVPTTPSPMSFCYRCLRSSTGCGAVSAIRGCSSWRACSPASHSHSPSTSPPSNASAATSWPRSLSAERGQHRGTGQHRVLGDLADLAAALHCHRGELTQPAEQHDGAAP